MAFDDWQDVDIQETQDKKARITELSVLAEQAKDSIFTLLFTEHTSEASEDDIK